MRVRTRRALFLAIPWLILAPCVAPAQSAEDADALYERAAKAYGAGDYETVIPLLEQAATIDEKLGAARIVDLAYDRKYLGICYADTNRSDAARAQLDKAQALFDAVGEPGERVETLNDLGLLEYYRAAYDAAESDFRAALSVARAAGLSAQVPSTLNNVGLVLSARGRYDEALALYQEAYDDHVKAGDAAAAAQSLGNIASVALALSRWSQAEDAYRRALASFEQQGDMANATNTRINLGILHTTQGSYDTAQSELEDGLARARALGLRQSEAYGLAYLGSVYYATGRYDLAEQTYLRALDMDRALDLQLNVVAVSTSLGNVYQAWGRYDHALELYGQSLDAAKRMGVPGQVIGATRLIGSVYAAQGRLDLAIDTYRQALALATAQGTESDTLPILDALGSAFFLQHSFDAAEANYRAALDLAQRLGLKAMEGRELVHVGDVDQAAGNRQAAMVMYRMAVQACRAAGTRVDEAVAWNNLGTLAIGTRSWTDAEDSLLQAIAIKEQLRSTAAGADRMDFLASQISSYRWLVAARVGRGDAAAAFEASEMMKARWLSEQLGAGVAAFPGIAALQAKLAPGVLVLDYANVDDTMPVLLSASRSAVRAWNLSLGSAAAVSGAGRPAAPAPAVPAPAGRGFTIVRTEPETAGFSDTVAAYRGLLANVHPSPTERAARDRMARQLYDMLIGPAEKELTGKDELLVVPEGSLCTLPFETLRMPDGRYLVERFHVTYVPSLTVKAQLEERRAAPLPSGAAAPQGTARSAGATRPLLAFGGASYGGGAAPQQRSISDQQLASLRLDAARLVQQNRGVRDLFATLGMDSWEDLPGTLAEVSAIGRLRAGSTILTGADASEQRIKQLSQSGELARYAVIHFATHGIAMPEAPELSALVLSLAAGEGNEDGYLTTREIAGLHLAADFVNLSACETGLGRILGGEGIVGLSEAFLTAGAAGLSVSLWPVADDATSQFMTGVYGAAGAGGLSYARALTEVKRRFIREGAWQEPFYWAPFVFYGVDAGPSP